MKFQITLKKDDLKWVVTQMGKFIDKNNSHYRLDCLAIRAHSPIEATFVATDGRALVDATVYMDRDSYDPNGEGADCAIFLPKTLKDALDANPKKGKEEVTLRIETDAKKVEGTPLHITRTERDDHAYLDGVEIKTEKGRFPDTESIHTNISGQAEMLFEFDAKAIKNGIKSYIDKAKVTGVIKAANFKSEGSICITSDVESNTCFMYVRRRVVGDKRIYRNQYGECEIGRILTPLNENKELYKEKHYLNPGYLLKVSEFLADANGLGVERTKFGVVHLYGECQKRARFVHVSSIIMPLCHDEPEITDGDVAPAQPSPPSTPDPTPAPTPKPESKPVVEIDDEVKDLVYDFLVDNILRHALNKRIGSNHYSAQVLGLTKIIDAVEEEYFRRVAAVKERISEDRFNLIQRSVDQFLLNQPDEIYDTIVKALRAAA